MRNLIAGGLGSAIAAVCVACTNAAGTGSEAASPSVVPSTGAPSEGMALGDFSHAEPGQPGCLPASPMIGNEVMGAVDDGSLFGLIFVEPPITTGEEVKIVWRMTGRGELGVDATHDGEPATVTFGPEAHGDSNWGRPGAEWGTGFVFPKPGCWHVRLRRGELSGDVYLKVDPRA